MDYTPGKIYEVPCAQLTLKEDGRVYYLPVIDQPHSDPAFDFPHRHYHIDGRFEIHPRMKHRLKIQDGYTATIILAEGSSMYDFNGISKQTLICRHPHTGLAVPPGSEKYRNWYEGYIGHSCAGRKCPHLGTEMLELDGQWICPLHGLAGNALTQKIIPAGFIALQ